jgi:hypothetical protein
MSFDAFTPIINESVWGNLMQQTSSAETGDTTYQNAGGSTVSKKYKVAIRDAVKNMISFLQHKEGQVQCDALDVSIAEGNRLLGLEKKSLGSEVEKHVALFTYRGDFMIGSGGRRQYAEKMLQQYTNELEKKRTNNCRVSGDKAVDYAEEGVQSGYDSLGYTPPPSGSTNIQQAGMGGNMMVYLTIGAIAFAGFFFIKSMTGKKPAVSPTPKLTK